MKAIINKNLIITDINEVYDYVLSNDLNMYEGHHNEPLVASFVSSKNRLKIRVEYSNFLECKRFEEMIKPHCIRFYPKKFSYDKLPIKVPKELKEELKKLKKGNESYGDVIWRLMLEHYNLI